MSDPKNDRIVINVVIKLDGSGFAHKTELELRWALEDQIIERGIGEMQDAGSGSGWMDFAFVVKNTANADAVVDTVSKLLEEYGMIKRARIEIFDS